MGETYRSSASAEETGAETPVAPVVETPVVTAPVERPAWLPENFKSPEDLVKSYKELQGQFTRARQEEKKAPTTPTTPPPPEQPKIDNETPEQKAARETANNVGLKDEDLNKWSEEYWNTGKISNETYETIAKAGIPRTVVDQFAAGQASLRQGAIDTVLNAGGGKESVQSMFTWAATTLPPEQVEHYNKQFASNDVTTAVMAMENLKLKYEAAEGKAPARQIRGASAPGHDGSVYSSSAQVVVDMQNPKYSSDPAFRRAVEEKLARSNVL